MFLIKVSPIFKKMSAFLDIGCTYIVPKGQPKIRKIEPCRAPEKIAKNAIIISFNNIKSQKLTKFVNLQIVLFLLGSSKGVHFYEFWAFPLTQFRYTLCIKMLKKFE